MSTFIDHVRIECEGLAMELADIDEKRKVDPSNPELLARESRVLKNYLIVKEEYETLSRMVENHYE
jgi:hypothetical protein